MQRQKKRPDMGFIMFLLFGMVFGTIFTRWDARSNNIHLGPYQVQAAAAHAPIHVTSNAALLAFPDKTGSGSEIDPVIIQNYQIDGGDSGSCIELRNVNLFVIIKNCTLNNSGSLLSNGDSGIELFNCMNVMILNCTIYSCMVGVWGIYSSWITIENSVLRNNEHHGIWLRNTDLSTVKNNRIHSNTRHGIMLETACSNKFSLNNCTSNGLRGFYADAFSSNNTAYLNYFSLNIVSQAWDDGIGNVWDTPIGNKYGDYALRYPLATNDGILWNTPYDLDGAAKAVDTRPVYSASGINLPISLTNNSQVDAFCNGNGTDGSSWVTAHRLQNFKISAGGGDYCIRLENMDRYIIIENCTLITALSNPWGSAAIMLQNCSNIKVVNCNVRYNSIGIKMYYQNKHCIIENNTISMNTYEGIYIFQSHNLTVINNSIHHNDVNGIHQWNNCQDNNITSNHVFNNRINGILLQNEENTTISNNVIENNYIGCQLIDSMNLTLNNNDVLNSTYYGFGIFGSIGGLVLESNQVIESYYAGVYIWNAYGIIMNANSMINASIVMEGALEHLRSYTIDTSNTVNGKSVRYYHDQNGLGPLNFTNAGQVILVNCNSSSIAGVSCAHGSNGITIYFCKNVSVSSSSLYKFTSEGVLIKASTNCNLTGNTFSDCVQGILISSCQNIMMTGNAFIKCGLAIEATVEQSGTYVVDSSNTVNGRILRYFVNQSGLSESAFTNAGQIILINCNNSRISNQNVSLGTIGVQGFHCNNINITAINARGNHLDGIRFMAASNINVSSSDASSCDRAGIYMIQASIITISRNVVDSCFWGIFIDRTSDSKVNDNDVSNCIEVGVYLSEASRATVEHNDVSGTITTGIYLNMSPFNQIIANEIYNNNETGIVCINSKWTKIVQNHVHGNGHGIIFYQNTSHNVLYFNTFTASHYSNVLYDIDYYGTNNTWTNGTEGNFWDDYSSRYPGATNLGRTWGTPYYLNGSVTDHDPHPLVHPWQPNIKPTALFVVQTSTIVLTGQPVMFIFLGSRGNEPASFQWSFGDGTANQTDQNPTHQFAIQGTFMIILTIVDADGQTSVSRRAGYIEAYHASGDFDGDGLTNEQELLHGTSITNQDTDGDGFSDKVEVDWGTNPTGVISSPLTIYIIPCTGVIGIVILATLARARKKTQLQLARNVVSGEQAINEELIDGSRLMREKIDAKKAILSRVLEPSTSDTEGPDELKQASSKKFKGHQEENVKHQVDEQTEREVDIFKKKELCIVCNTSLKATTYICPHCETKYCIRCAIALSERKEPCWSCHYPMNFNP